MPATYKCTWFFEGLQQQIGTTSSSDVGWTETWYGTFDSIEEALFQMRSLAVNSYLSKRLAFLPEAYRLAWCRASEVTRPNNSKLAGPPAFIVGNALRLPVLAAAGAAAQVNCCVYVDFWAPPRNDTDKSHHRRFLIRGLPVDMITGNIIKESSPFFSKLIEFCIHLGQHRSPRAPGFVPEFVSKWLMKVQDNTVLPVAPSSLIVDPDNPKGIVVTATGVGSAMGQKFLLKSVRFPSFINRVWTAQTVIAPGGAIVMRPGRKQLAGAWDHTGTITAVQPAFISSTQFTIIGLRNRKIGPPSKPTRGRRRAG